MRSEEEVFTLFHGTTRASAEALMQNGWQPNSWPAGSSCGQPCYLYLTTDPMDALWFAEEKGDDVVLEIRGIPAEALLVDPEDGVGEDIAEEMNSPHGFPGKLVVTRELSPDQFAIYDFAPKPK